MKIFGLTGIYKFSNYTFTELWGVDVFIQIVDK